MNPINYFQKAEIMNREVKFEVLKTSPFYFSVFLLP